MIESFSLSETTWAVSKDRWETTCTVNHMKNVFSLIIENGQETMDISYKKSTNSKEYLDGLAKRILQNERFASEVNKIKMITAELTDIAAIKNIDSIEINLLNYLMEYHWEHMTFQVRGYKTHFHWAIKEKERIFYPSAYIDGEERRNCLRYIEEHLSKELILKIKEQVRKHPIARLRRLFKQ